MSVKMLVAQSRPTLCDSMDYTLPGSSVHGVIQARVLEPVAIPFSGDLSYPEIEPGCPAFWADSLPSETPGKPQTIKVSIINLLTISLEVGWSRLRSVGSVMLSGVQALTVLPGCYPLCVSFLSFYLPPHGLRVMASAPGLIFPTPMS